MTVLAQYTDDRRNLAIADRGDGIGPRYELILDASDGLETVIKFDALEVSRTELVFKVSRSRGMTRTASIENHLDAWGGVGAWLRGHAASTSSAVANC